MTGVDPAPVMLQLARRLTSSATWSISTVHHWRDVDAGLEEAFRVLARGGRMLAIERHSQPGATGLASHGWTDDQAAAFADQCQRAGFTDVRVTSHDAGRKSVLVVQGARP